MSDSSPDPRRRSIFRILTDLDAAGEFGRQLGRALPLSVKQIREIEEALLDAFPTRDDLRYMVRIELDEWLEAIADGANQRVVTFNLVRWAEQTGKIDALLQGASRQNPDNPILQKLMQTWRATIAFDWVTIPAGEFLMGRDEQRDKWAYGDEKPQHTLYLPEYRISRTPVTVGQLAAFVDATGHKTSAEESGSAWVYSTTGEWKEVKGANWAHPRGPRSNVSRKQDHPVTQVSWSDAQAFCAWAGVRLPSEAEWEKAARGTDGRLYPWGDAPPTDQLCNFGMNLNDTRSVGSYPAGASPYGCLDMAGNVWEWTSSLWGKGYSKPDYGYPYDPADGREDLSAPDSVFRVARGGSWGDNMHCARCSARDRHFNLWNGDGGFRVVSPGF